MPRPNIRLLFIYGVAILGILAIASGLNHLFPPLSSPALTVTWTPTVAPTTPTPTPKDCPDAYERTPARHPSMSEEERRSYRPTLSEPGLTLYEALCVDVLRRIAENKWVTGEEEGAIEALGRELAQEPLVPEGIARAVQRWYRALPDTYWSGPSFSVNVSFTDSHRLGGEPTYAVLLTISGREFPMDLGTALNRRYGSVLWKPLRLPTGGGEIIVCTERDKELIMRAASRVTAARVLGAEDDEGDTVYCRPGLF